MTDKVEINICSTFQTHGVELGSPQIMQGEFGPEIIYDSSRNANSEHLRYAQFWQLINIDSPAVGIASLNDVLDYNRSLQFCRHGVTLVNALIDKNECLSQDVKYPEHSELSSLLEEVDTTKGSPCGPIQIKLIEYYRRGTE